MNKKDQLTTFLERISKLEAIEFIGLAKVLCVELIEEDKETQRPFEDILADMMINYTKAARKSRRQIDKVLRDIRK